MLALLNEPLKNRKENTKGEFCGRIEEGERVGKEEKREEETTKERKERNELQKDTKAKKENLLRNYHKNGDCAGSKFMLPPFFLLCFLT